MDLLAIIGFVVFIYYLVYMIFPWFLDCDLKLAWYEKFGKPISSLKGKTVWITGASSGIGEHLAYVLADAGCKLILTARRKEQLDRVKAGCLQKNTNLDENDIEVLVLDIREVDEHENAFKRVLDKFGKLDILVNNAGCSQRARWEEIDLSVDKELFDLNVFSVLSLSRLVTKYFLKRGNGHIVVTSSMAGLGPTAYSATYSGTKFALHGYFNCLWLEKIDKNIAITLACPGPVLTNLFKEAYTETVGEKYNEEWNANSKNKISAERCATLMGIAIANQLYEIWISKPLLLQLLYLKTYHPNLGYLVFKILGPRFLMKLRDDKSTIRQET